MFEKPEFNENNELILCTLDGKNPEMRMRIKVKRLSAGETVSIQDPLCETAVMLLEGAVRFRFDGREETGARRDPFEKKPYALHVCRGTAVSVVGMAPVSEIVIQQTENEKAFAPVFYDPSSTLYQEFGKDQWGGAGHRIVSTLFDHDNAPYSNMVLGEVFTQPGKWSSYPPHHHPQPEVYYYRFDKPQGFGAAYVGDDVYKSRDRSYIAIPGGKDHQQAAAPGYEMYYVWMVRHIEGDPWLKTSRFVGREHEWLING